MRRCRIEKTRIQKIINSRLSMQPAEHRRPAWCLQLKHQHPHTAGIFWQRQKTLNVEAVVAACKQTFTQAPGRTKSATSERAIFHLLCAAQRDKWSGVVGGQLPPGCECDLSDLQQWLIVEDVERVTCAEWVTADLCGSPETAPISQLTAGKFHPSRHINFSAQRHSCFLTHVPGRRRRRRSTTTARRCTLDAQ